MFVFEALCAFCIVAVVLAAAMQQTAWTFMFAALAVASYELAETAGDDVRH